MVFDAEECSGISAAIKKSRVSLRVKRTMLRHEARVLQLLQGHPAQRFEYIAIDRLGQNLKDICKTGHSVKLEDWHGSLHRGTNGLSSVLSLPVTEKFS